jgi:hypoxanthine phosphoribosyltransferase
LAIEICAAPAAGWSEPTARREPPRFAHPAEELLASLLSFHHVRWLYEPTSFVLRRTETGEAAECFTPDFHLPDHGVYLELTTMRQPLVTRKNGKVRRLRELYPEVRIATLYRRDYERIIETAGPRVVPERGATVHSEDEIQRRVTEMADEVAAALPAGRLALGPLILAALRAEAAPFQAALADRLTALDVATESTCLAMPRFDPASARLAPAFEFNGPIWRNRAVVLITGAVSTGLSLDFARRQARNMEPAWLGSAALLDRPSARIVDAPVEFRGFLAPSECLSGFGLAVAPDGHWRRSIFRVGGKSASRQHAGG